MPESPQWRAFGDGGEEERILGQRSLVAIDQKEASLIETMKTPGGYNGTLVLYVGAQTPESFAALPRDAQEAILNLAAMSLTRLSVLAAQQSTD